MAVKRAKTTCFTIIAITLCLFFGASLNTLMQAISYPNKTEDLDSNWNYSINNDARFTAIPHISHHTFTQLKKGDCITLTHPMPVTDAMHPVLLLDTDNTAIEAFNGEALVFSYGNREATFIGSGTAIIPLDSFGAHNGITLKLYPLNVDSGFRIRPPKLIPATEYSTRLIHNNLFSFACTVFLFVIGVSGTLISIGVLFVKKPSYLLLALSQCALWAGVALLCSNGFIQFFSADFSFNTNLLYLSFSLMLLCLITVLFLQQTDVKYQTVNRVFFVLFAAVLFVTTVITPLLRGAYALYLDRFYVTAITLSVAYVVFRSLRCIAKQSVERAIMPFGIIALFLFWLLDVIRFFVSYYALGSFAKLHPTYFTFGMVILCVCAAIHYLYTASARARMTARDAIQEESKSIDHTTGTFNRIKTIETLQNLDRTENEYGIITITLTEKNGTVHEYTSNDEETARITALASIIKRVFDCYGVVGRLDDKKFVVVTVGVMRQKLVQLMYVFNGLVAIENNHASDALCIKTGYAVKGESTDEDYSAVYARAESCTFGTSNE